MIAADDKVAPLPTLLERLGKRIDNAWWRTHTSDQEWVEGSLELAQALAESRNQFPADQAFGQWLTANKHDHVAKNDRAALINLTSDIIIARDVLSKTKSRSYRLIWDEQQGRFPSPGKPDKPKRGRPKSNKPKKQPKKPGEKQSQRSINATDAEWAHYKELALKQGYPSVAAALGALVANPDKGREEGRRDLLAELDTAAAKNFTEKGKLKVTDAIRIHKARLDKQFAQRVNDEVRRRIEAADHATREQNKKLSLRVLTLERAIKDRAVFTPKQFHQMQLLCHPDSSASEKTKAELSQILVENELKLVKLEK